MSGEPMPASLQLPSSLPLLLPALLALLSLPLTLARLATLGLDCALLPVRDRGREGGGGQGAGLARQLVLVCCGAAGLLLVSCLGLVSLVLAAGSIV